jgi:hypothetical protein
MTARAQTPPGVPVVLLRTGLSTAQLSTRRLRRLLLQLPRKIGAEEAPRGLLISSPVPGATLASEKRWNRLGLKMLLFPDFQKLGVQSRAERWHRAR